MKPVKIKKKKKSFKSKPGYNKTLVVGHILSDHKSVIGLLHASGMQEAQPLQKESVEATEISKILTTNHSSKKSAIKQLKVDKVWNGLALDLLMSNRDAKWWGWYDSEALPLLNYWKSLDSKMGFILVYDTPESFLQKALASLEVLNEENLDDVVQEWCRYNEALLKFYYRNTASALLINTQQAKLTSAEYLQQVTRQIGLKEAQLSNSAITMMQASFQEERGDPLFTYLLQDLLKKYPSLNSLFNELQSVASLPYVVPAASCATLDALNALRHEQKSYLRVTTELSSLQNEQDELIAQEAEKSQENQDLLTQLMLVQEELENYYLKNSQSAKRLAELSKQIEAAKEAYNTSLAEEQAEKAKVLAALEKRYEEQKVSNEQLITQLENTKTERRELFEKRERLSQENEELLTQMMSVQEELESYYVKNEQTSKTLADVKAQLERSQEAYEKALVEQKLKTETFEKVKKALQQEKASVEKQLSQELSTLQKQQEELRTSDQQKSKENEALLEQLMSVQEELERYYLENQTLKEQQREQKRHYGAAERVKSQLSYRLGAKMIEQSHSFWGKVALPFSLRRVYLEYQEEMKSKQGIKLPKIEEYADAYEVPRIKKHLSYRLGQVLIASTQTPFGIFALPSKLRQAHQAFKKDREDV